MLVLTLPCRSLAGVLVEAVRSVLKKRPGKRRRIIVLLLSIMLLLVASISGGWGGYLFTRKMFHWDEMIYTEVGTVMTILSTTCDLFLLPLLSYTLQIPDHIIGLVATLSSFSHLAVNMISLLLLHLLTLLQPKTNCEGL